MISPAKVLFYLFELINCYAAVYYSNFLFFYLRRTFGFGEVENLLTAALGGFVYESQYLPVVNKSSTVAKMQHFNE